ncbi:hypothetical protein RvY_10495 [Ramazzottius varieornatus]|uniref:Uncharacterized protein n=1 Tax=Ramazzottius varieornatus TaxID=947166 RepID=A0A1D1VHF2_RAMVA|nr:hypothetical protein RvY_10495 [Ramazzottius varieornatus]
MRGTTPEWRSVKNKLTLFSETSRFSILVVPTFYIGIELHPFHFWDEWSVKFLISNGTASSQLTFYRLSLFPSAAEQLSYSPILPVPYSSASLTAPAIRVAAFFLNSLKDIRQSIHR